jgi:hypothetical protein
VNANGVPTEEIAAKLAEAARNGGTAVEAAQVHAEASPETTRTRTPASSSTTG